MNINRLTRLAHVVVLLCLTGLTTDAWAQWSLDNTQSKLSFVSIKATHVGEIHTFEQLSGQLDASGKASVTIDLASVETLIPIRNERMREFLFETASFPTATVTAQLDPATLQALQPGDVNMMALEASVQIKDQTTPVTAQVLAAKVDAKTMVVTTSAPILVTPAMLGLSEGVEKLRELAGLPNISQAVPVTFVLTFRHETK